MSSYIQKLFCLCFHVCHRSIFQLSLSLKPISCTWHHPFKKVWKNSLETVLCPCPFFLISRLTILPPTCVRELCNYECALLKTYFSLFSLGCGLLMVTTVLVYFIDEDSHPEAIKYIDPCISLLSILIIVITSWPLSHKLATILPQNSPVDVQKLKAEILFTFPQIFSVHEFHTWSLMHGQIVANLHVTYQSFDVSKSPTLIWRIF